MITINKRQESKERTRNLIIVRTNELIRRKGILSLTTAEVAKECGIAHGSIFLHFGTRENLINVVLEEEIKRIARFVKEQCSDIWDIDKLLERFFDVVACEEDFFTTIYKEMPFLPGEVNRNIIAMEAVIRNAFYLAIDKSSIRNPAGEEEITIGLDAFFAMLARFLTLKELYSPDESVILKRKADLIKLFNMLFKERSGKDERKNM